MKNLGLELRMMMDHLTRSESDHEVNTWLGTLSTPTKTIEQLIKLPGDASTRKYYRVLTKETSYIVMKMESFANEGMQLPFLVLQKHLTHCGIDVPQVLDVDPDRGFILLEDLGDVTLLRHLQEVANPQVERELYERVIDDLIDLHLRASPNSKSPALDAFQLSFNHEKLMWEVNFCIEHFYQKFLAREMQPSDLKIMQNRFSEICTILANEPTVFTHRDFHSRNIMVKDDRLVMIDFQDARMGPAQYDLASLLKDSYYQIEDSQVQRLLDYYMVRREAISGIRMDREHFIRIFDLMALQRNFKAIGSFASFQNRRGNPGYLKYIGNTFENIRRTLLKYPEYSDLREVLFHHYYF